MAVTKLTHDIIGWKVAFVFSTNFSRRYMGIMSGDGKEHYRVKLVLVKLRIKKGATVVDGGTLLYGVNKRRCSSAEVLGVYTFNEKCKKLPDSTIARSLYHPTFKYYVGKNVVPSKPFDRGVDVSCGSGIHFFDRKSEAIKYVDWYAVDTWPWSDIMKRCGYLNFNFLRFNKVLAFTRKLYEEQVAGRKEK